MNGLVLDTNVLIDLFEGECTLPTEFSCYERILIPSIVIGEYRAGLFPTKNGDVNRRKLEAYLDNAAVVESPVTPRTAELYAKVYQALRKNGRLIPQNDMWIAASALEHGADIVTKSDEHFKAVPMLTVITI